MTEQIPHNLRTAAPSMVGRRAELAELTVLIASHRLVTIAGPGGCGKTRLAAELSARRVVLPVDPPAGADELRWLDLASAPDATTLLRSCARELGVHLEAGKRDPVAALVARIRNRRVILVLDACEHLLDPVADLVEHILTECPGISVVATSREPLSVPGETVWRVPALNADDAAQLFMERARSVAQDLPPHAPEAAAICARLDGLPLAIELAAAWTRMLSPAQILAGLDDRFRLLTGGMRRSIPRHRTLEASMAWSYDLLEGQERSVLGCLAVFVGDFGIPAVDEVCEISPEDGETIQLLARLVDKSLIIIAARDGEQARFRLLDTVREYAGDRLAETGGFAQTRDRHLDWCLGRLHAVEQLLRSDQDAALRLFDEIEPDAATALDWALQADDRRQASGRRLAQLMVTPWFLRSRSDLARPLMTRAIASTVEPDDGLQPLLESDLALIDIVAGRRAPALAPHSATTEENLLARARFGLVDAYEASFYDHEACERESRAASELGGRAGDPLVEDFGLILAAYSLTARERHDEARELAAPASARARARGDRFCTAFALGVEQFGAMQTGHLADAIRLGHDAIALAAPLGDYFCVGTLTANLALAMALSGDHDGVLRIMAPLIDVTDSRPDIDVVGLPVPIGYSYLRAGGWEEAQRWFDRGLARLTPGRPDWTAARCLPGAVEALRRLGRITEATALAERGQHLPITAPDFVANLAEQRAHLVSTDSPFAESLHQRALDIRIRSGLRTFIPDSLDALARCQARERPADAARLLASSTAAREAMHYPRSAGGDHDHDLLFTDLSERLGSRPFDEAWRHGLVTRVDEACDLAQRGRRRPARPGTGWASLTPAELAVAQIAAQGRTNPDIARELVVSRATVKTHLYHVFAKLGIGNRTELAAIAHSQSRLPIPEDGPPR
ncbi:LuxR C-terminal-related transcriptional regulator [Occultella aeris]|uniref:HTH-type transcriptional regulator/MT0914 n=1 Tax=Occultella aeris TaxID=2761496 RepID=A0A7M4DIE5_9MICO|nr:LuxR C-terminal-related transcriptional regulator [Occultella aeris]VZO36718.1 Putative HTH-type transcriptional regulator/MT0914 [Occultella aeris]